MTKLKEEIEDKQITFQIKKLAQTAKCMAK